MLRIGRLAVLIVLLTIQTPSHWSISSPDVNPPHPKAISADDFKVPDFDPRDALVRHSVAYEFDVEIDRKVLPFKLLEDVNKWEYVDIPLFRVEGVADGGKGLVEKCKMDHALPILEPFQLAGSMQLWIHDAENMQLSLPHDVDAGVLKKVILADGAVVTVTGARSASLRHPVDLPLPLIITVTD